jgi:alkylation response protein AidB-like acyl-CoA dehydrogenase
MSTVADQVKGGGFILKPANKSEIFMPESMTEEQAMVVKSTRDFVTNEMRPIRARIEAKEAGLAESVFLKMGELGLLGAHMPEQYGGSELDANTIALMLTVIGDMGSFNTPYAAHTGIGMLPILYFGTEAQKEKYLPPMITGELIGSYCLTEPTSGSDALSAKTQAVYDEADKTYVLNGQKMWISNAGYAGIFIVFAQVDGDKFTAFIVPREAEGLTLGAEEEKLGIHGSSTRQVYLEDVKVPEGAVLGEIGKGHLIAFNVLNMGRFKLGAMCACGSIYCLKISTEYAKQRVQFGTPIASFGAIQEKLAWMAVRTAALQSATFRISSQLTKMIESLKSDGVDPGMAKLSAAKEFAVECSIIKVAGSEAIDFIADETVQVFGGMGYSEEAEPAQIYRDARINRIYEGTNEINRLLIVDQLFKKGMKGELPLMQVLMSGLETPDLDHYSQEAHVIREVIVKLLGYVGRRQMSAGMDLEKEQEVTMALSDIGIALYMLESLWMRKERRKDLGLEDQEAWEAMYKLQALRSVQTTHTSAFKVLSRLFKGEELQSKSMKIMAMAGLPDVDVVELQRTVASTVIERDGKLF